MKTLNRTLLTLAVLATFTAGAISETMSKSEFQNQKMKIEANFKAEKEACKPLAGAAHSTCLVKAKGVEKTAKAELEVSYKPGAKSNYTASMAKAEVAYDIALEACDEKTANAKDVCVKEAKAAQIAAKADAKVQLKSVEANATAAEIKSDARSVASEDKNNALYVVAKEKCDKFSSDAKTTCLDQAKKTYAK